MKILQVIHDFLPKHQAGSELYTYHLSKELSKRHKVHLLFTESNPDQHQYSVKKGDYEGLPYTKIINNLAYSTFEEIYNNPSVDKIFEIIIDDFKPDIVHLQHLLHLSINLIAIAKKRSIPVVFTLHDYWLTCPSVQRLKSNLDLCLNPESCTGCDMVRSSKMLPVDSTLKRFFPNKKFRAPFGLRKLTRIIREKLSPAIDNATVSNEMQKRRDYLKRICHEVDLFISPSMFMKKEMIRFGIPAEKIIYSDNGHPPFCDCNIARVPSDKIRFSYLGTVIQHKGLHVLVEAFENVSPEKAELNIYGDLSGIPAYSQKVMAMATNPSIKFHGRIDHAQLKEALARTDVLVVPSIWFENSPLTIHEAFQVGIPVITSNIGGMAELVTDGLNGLLFERGNVVDLQKKLQMIIDRPQILNELKHFPKIKTIEEDARDMEERYEQLIKKSDDSESNFPAASSAAKGWNDYSQYWEKKIKNKEVQILGEEWFTKVETNQIFETFCLPYLSKDKVVLEIGCGGGKYSSKVVPHCKELTCLDVSQEMLNRTRQLLKDVQNVRFIQGNGLDLKPIKTESCDFVFSFDVFVHIDLEDMYCYFREVKRVLKKGGHFAVHIADLMTEEGWKQFVREVDQNRGDQKLFCRLRYMTFEMLQKLTSELGYKLLKTNSINGNKFIAIRDNIVVLEK